MPFTPETKNPGDLIRSADWNAAMTAIAQLFAKLDQATGHRHTGAVEDGPQIGTNGLSDNAVTAIKIAAGAVTAAKLGGAAVTADKLADAAVTAAKLGGAAVTADKIADTAVTAAKLANNAVTTAKIADAAVTAAKLASGVIPQIGIAVTPGLTHNQSIPVPSGFTRQECIFMVAMKYLNLGGDNTIINCTVDSEGKVSATPDGYVAVVGVAFGKKGGW